MRRIFPHPWGWASLAPLLCAVHCAVTPVLVVLAPALVPGERFEWTLLGLTVLLGGVALAVGIHRHGDLRPVLAVIAGLAGWSASLLDLFRPAPEEMTTVAASLVVALGLIWNARIHCAWRARAGRGCEACRSEAAAAPPPARPARTEVAP